MKGESQNESDAGAEVKRAPDKQRLFADGAEVGVYQKIATRRTGI